LEDKVRIDGRQKDELRPTTITLDFIKYAEGSALIEVGNTKIICTATLEDNVPLFLKDQNQGWVTAEYSMLPRSTPTRTRREAASGKISGRTQEIQRLIGRALRSIIDLTALGEMTIWLDCDVIQADGGTRTASVTGAFVALRQAINYALSRRLIRDDPIRDHVAAVSVGIIGGETMLDLCYSEDSRAEVDMNIVTTGSGEFVEIQGTAETRPFNLKQNMEMLELAHKGISELIQIQQRCF
jgi:ribonuclease PH